MSSAFMGLAFSQIKAGGDFLFVDGKRDVGLYKETADEFRRAELLKAEKVRRRVKFLPKQVMRAIYEREGVPWPQRWPKRRASQ